MYSGLSIRRNGANVYTETGDKITLDNALTLVPELDNHWGLKYSEKYAFALVEYHGKPAKDVKMELITLITEMVHAQKLSFSKKYRGLIKLLLEKGILIDDRPRKKARIEQGNELQTRYVNCN